MKRWKYSTLFLLAVLVVGTAFVVFNSEEVVADHNADDLGCVNHAECIPPDPLCAGLDPADQCGPNGEGWCSWVTNDLLCCELVLACRFDVCCQGPGCGAGCAPPSCGDGVLDFGEDCDNWGVCTITGQWCDTANGNSDCSDGVCIPNNDEECYFCQFPGCGNGIVDPPEEECDDGDLNGQEGSDCTVDCTIVDDGGGMCGNGDLEGIEECEVGQEDLCVVGLCDLETCTCEDEVDVPNQCEDSQRMFRISDVDDAHGEKWNEDLYDIEICYDEIFEVEYRPGNVLGENQECNIAGNNVVVRLDYEDGTFSNAHAEDPYGNTDGYSDVCFGDLECELVEGIDCNAEQTKVVGLELEDQVGDTNGHLQDRDINTYSHSICCIALNGVTKAEWQDLEGELLTEAWIDWNVRMFASTTFLEGTEVTFEIWDEDDFFNDPVDIGVPSTDLADINGDVSIDFKITEEMIDALNDNGIGGPDCEEGGGLEFYFKASGPEGDDGTSGQLLVHCEDNRVPPIAIISDPIHRQAYFVNTELHFDGSQSQDPEGEPLQYLWTVLDDGNLVDLGDNENGEPNEEQEEFDFTFTDDGMKTITLRVTDPDGLWDEDQIAITIIPDHGMIGFINKPDHHEIVPDMSENPLHEVSFSASDSYIIESETIGVDCPAVNCLAGFCPTETKNVPLGICDPLEEIPIDNLPNPYTVENSDWDPLSFSWTFSDDVGDPYGIEENGRYNGDAVYTAESNDYNDKHINLILDYTTLDGNGDPIISEVEETNRAFTLGQCLNNGNIYVDLDGTEHSTSEDDVCDGADQLIGTRDDCCPGSEICLEDNEGFANCEIPEVTVESCDDYNHVYDFPDSETNCIEDIHDIGTLPEPVDQLYYADGYNCGTIQEIDGEDVLVQCGCEWSVPEDETEIEKCVFATTWVDLYDDGGVCELGYCEISTDAGAECIDGVIVFNVDANFVGNDLCTNDGDQGLIDQLTAECNERDGVQTIPCGSLNFELGFFDWINFAIAALAIFIIYAIIGHVEARRKKRE